LNAIQASNKREREERDKKERGREGGERRKEKSLSSELNFVKEVRPLLGFER
jgi:hypothetical protein